MTQKNGMKFLIVFLLTLLTLNSCKKKENKTITPEPEISLYGEWNCDYSQLHDSNKYSAMLEYDYADGFVLYKDGNGAPLRSKQITSFDMFKWKYVNNKLIINYDQFSPDPAQNEFTYDIWVVTSNSMVLKNVSGLTYRLVRE